MEILVPVKRVVDPYVKIRVKPDHSGVDLQNVKMAMNPFDEIALEEAIRLKEKGLASTITIASIGSDACLETLRHGLALGADKGMLLRTDKPYCSLNIAKILQAIIIKGNYSLVLMGKQSIDGDNNQTPQMLAGLLNWPQATFASAIVIEGNNAEVTRETDTGLEKIKVKLPAVISTDLRLNEPRYTSLPNIMKAKSKPLETIEVDSLAVTLKEHKRVVSVTAPPGRSQGMMVNSVEELIKKLQQEEHLL